MSNQKVETSDEKQGGGRMNDLRPEEETLSAEEAREVKGGGGSLGGVIRQKTAGEEIPQ